VDNTAGEGIKELEHDITRNDVLIGGFMKIGLARC
jgi:hypothetical protein